MKFTIRGDEPLPVDAQTAGEELERIRLEHHQLTPAVVVDESRPEDAPLHPVFEWQDERAAELYREHQASTLIRRVRIVRPDAEQEAAMAQGLVPQLVTRPLPADHHTEPSYDVADPIGEQMAETVGLLIESCRRLEELHSYACRRMDSKLKIALQVALDEVRDAHEVLLASRVERPARVTA